MKKILSLVGIVCVLAVLVGALSGVTFATETVAMGYVDESDTTGTALDFSGLTTALGASGTYYKVKLTDDLTISSQLEIRRSVIFDLGGHTLTSVMNGTSHTNALNIQGTSTSAALAVDVTITHGTVVADQYGVYTRWNSGTISIEDVHMVAGVGRRNTSADPCVGGPTAATNKPFPTVNITNSTLVTVCGGNVLACNAAEINFGADVHVYSTAATTPYYNTGGTATGSLSQIETAKGYNVKIGDTVYTGLNYWTTATTPNANISVAKAYTLATDENPAATLLSVDDLLSAVSGGTYAKIVLTEDVSTATALQPKAALVLDLGGNTLTYTAQTAGAIKIAGTKADNVWTPLEIDGTVTVKNGTILASWYGIYLQQASVDVVVEDLTIVAGRTLRTGEGESTSAIGSATGGTYNVTVTNSTLISQDDNAAVTQGTNTTVNVTLNAGVTMYSVIPNYAAGAAVTGDVYVAGMAAPGVDGIGRLYKWSTDAEDEKSGEPLAWVCNAAGTSELYPLYTAQNIKDTVVTGMTASYIKLVQDVTNNAVQIYHDTIIDLNGNEWVNTSGSGIQVKGAATVTVKNGIIEAGFFPLYAFNTSSNPLTVNLTAENLTLKALGNRASAATPNYDPALGFSGANASSSLTVKDCILISPVTYPITTKAGQTVTLEGDVKLYGLGEDYVSVREGVTVTAPMIKPVSSDIAGVNKWIPFNVFINASAALYMDDPWGYQITVNPVDADDIPLSESDQFVEDLKLYWIAGGNMPTVEYMLANGTVVDFEGSDTANILGQVKVAELNETMNMVIEYTFESVTEYYSISVTAEEILAASKEADPSNAGTYDALAALFEAFTDYEAAQGDRTALEVTEVSADAYTYFEGKATVAGEVKTYAAAYLMEPWGLRFSTETVEGATAYGFVVGTDVYDDAAHLLSSGAGVYVAEAAGTRAYAAFNGVSTLALNETVYVLSFVEADGTVTYGEMHAISVYELLQYLSENSLGTAEELAVIDSMLTYVDAFVQSMT